MKKYLIFSCLMLCGACGEKEARCKKDFDYAWQGIIPGPAETGFDATLALTAERRDRQFHAFHTRPTGLNQEISIARSKTSIRQAIEDFVLRGQGYDFEGTSGYKLEEIIDGWWKVAGMYAGAGLAADAYRYGVMRDQCYPQDQVDMARRQLIRGLDGLIAAFEITGGQTIARGLSNRRFPGGDQTTTPLFDEQGNPLPPEKNNGTWREDNSGGKYPDYIWEDSCSRDMLIGWMVGLGAAWEVISQDGEISESYRVNLREYSRRLGENLRRVRENGYDLELTDADGRTTYHGYLNENNVDRIYIDGARNGFHTIMALGIMGVLVEVSGDESLRRYLYQELIDERQFAKISRENLYLVNMGETTNFSNYNMAFDGAWLALRFIQDQEARADIQAALEEGLYRPEGESFIPLEQKQSFFDLVYLTGRCDAAFGRGCLNALDQIALERALETLAEFPPPPFWEFERINCDEQEIASGHCVAEDGTEFTVLGYVGRNGDLITKEPVPMRLRPPSNYYWRSNPYEPNGGAAGDGMFPGPDFRLAYWMGRWLRR